MGIPAETRQTGAGSVLVGRECVGVENGCALETDVVSSEDGTAAADTLLVNSVPRPTVCCCARARDVVGSLQTADGSIGTVDTFTVDYDRIIGTVANLFVG